MSILTAEGERERERGREEVLEDWEKMETVTEWAYSEPHTISSLPVSKDNDVFSVAKHSGHHYLYIMFCNEES